MTTVPDKLQRRNTIGRARGRIRDFSDTEMDITPMIDITFLLLIFFLVASRIDSNTVLELPAARNGTTVAVDNSVVLTVLAEANGVLVYSGESPDASTQLGAADPTSQNSAVQDFVQRELRGPIPKQQVLLRADKGIKHREISRLISAIGEVDGASVYVAVIEES